MKKLFIAFIINLTFLINFNVQAEEILMTPKKTLVVYFSHSGNTQKIAEHVAQATKADLARIETVTPYLGEMKDVSAQGKKEVDAGFKPEIKPLNVNIASYERVIIGTPTWWYTMAPAVLTFFTNTDLSNKEVVLYMTNAGWPGTVIKDMTAAAKGAKIIATKEILFDSDGGNQMMTSREEIDNWINSWK